MDFGAWDGRRWIDIAWPEVSAWEADLLHHAPGGAETLAALAQRVQEFVAHSVAAGVPRLVVSHGGWINALLHLPPGCVSVSAADWPAAPPHAALRCWGAALLPGARAKPG